MLIVVSDLHLADDARRSTFDAAAFAIELEGCLTRLQDAERASLVLLGDIFELLKSSRWIDEPARPWRGDPKRLNEIVIGILDSIKDVNSSFFANLFALRERGVTITYLAGNHDGLLADNMLGPARAKLRELVCVQGCAEQAFDKVLRDYEHGVYAIHGHEFDDFNRITLEHGKFVPGDAIVIELLTCLPYETAVELKIASGSSESQARKTAMEDQFAPELKFLHELDNVLPQHAKGLISWIDACLEQMGENDRTRIEPAVLRALHRCADQAYRQADTNGGLSKLTKAQIKLLQSCVRQNSFRVASLFAAFEPVRPDEINRVVSRVTGLSANEHRFEQDLHLFLAGHTHVPLHHPIPVGNGRVVTYLNSGTWRRVHQLVKARDKGPPTFLTISEETTLCIHQRVGGEAPRYEFRRHARRL